MNATTNQSQSQNKAPGSTHFTKASVQHRTVANEATAIWLKSCDSPARFYLDRLEGKPITVQKLELPPTNKPRKGTPSRLRRMQKPRGIRSGFTDCIRFLLSWRLFGPTFAF